MKHTTILGHFNGVSSIGFILGPAVGGHIAEKPGGFYTVAILAGMLFFINFGKTLWGLGTLGRFSAIIYKGHNFCDFLFPFLHIKLLLKGVYSERKAFAPKGSKCFPFRIDPFQNGANNFES